jgi:hypothetical protein
MQPMPNWPNGLVYHTAEDISTRELLVSSIAAHLQVAFKKLNRAIDFIRVETPCIVPSEVLKQHREANFELWKLEDSDFYLRPESTAGTYLMFPVLFPQKKQLERNLPLCLWQSSLSFRVEQDKSFANLRFKQFYQLEFQLAYSPSTQADYHAHAVATIKDILKRWFKQTMREEELDSDRPFYSERTTDIYLDQWEVVAVSTRTDFDYPVVEVSCGLDRLTAIFLM